MFADNKLMDKHLNKRRIFYISEYNPLLLSIEITTI